MYKPTKGKGVGASKTRRNTQTSKTDPAPHGDMSEDGLWGIPYEKGKFGETEKGFEPEHPEFYPYDEDMDCD